MGRSGSLSPRRLSLSLAENPLTKDQANEVKAIAIFGIRRNICTLDSFLEANPELYKYHPLGKYPHQQKVRDINRYGKSADGKYLLKKERECPTRAEAPLAHKYLEDNFGWSRDRPGVFMPTNENEDYDDHDEEEAPANEAEASDSDEASVPSPPRRTETAAKEPTPTRTRPQKFKPAPPTLKLQKTTPSSTTNMSTTDPPANSFSISELSRNAVQSYNNVHAINPFASMDNPRGVLCWATPQQGFMENGKKKTCTKISVMIECFSEEDAAFTVSASLEEKGKAFALDRPSVDPNVVKYWDEVKFEMSNISDVANGFEADGAKTVEGMVSFDSLSLCK